MIDTAAQRSGALFESGWFCAESVLLAIAESKAIQSDLIPKIATGFCSGLSRTCAMCGAVSGAIMGISVCAGRTSPTESVDPTYVAVRELLAMFQAKFGSTNCRELIRCDLSTEEGRNHFKESNLKADCKAYTEEATRMALTIMERSFGNSRT